MRILARLGEVSGFSRRRAVQVRISARADFSKNFFRQVGIDPWRAGTDSLLLGRPARWQGQSRVDPTPRP